MREALLHLKTYQDILNEIKLLEAELESMPAHLKTHQDEVAQFEQKCADCEKEIANQKDKKRQADKDREEWLNKKEKYQSELEKVTNNESYLAILGEIDTSKDKINRATQEREAAEAELTQLKPQLDDLQSCLQDATNVLKAALAEHHKGQQEQRAHLKALQADEKTVRATIPAGSLSKFNRIAQRRNGVGLAVVRENEDVCLSCHVRVRKHVVNQIRKGDKILHCESCQRILFFVPKPEEEEPAEGKKSKT